MDPRTRVLLWHHAGPQNRLAYLYLPVRQTLLAGFRAARGVQITAGSGTRRPPEFKLFHGNLSRLRRGDVFIWIGLTMDHAPWRALRERGVRCILYQTEPVHTCMAHRTGVASPASALPPHCRSHRSRAPPSGVFAVDEIWDFSHHNLESCRRETASAPATLRYVPLGSVASAARQTQPRVCSKPGALIFFGNVYEGPLRKRCWQQLRAALPKRVYSTCAHGPWTFRVSPFDGVSDMLRLWAPRRSAME
jgi:hypothetical protein